jgi:hypothetical protein
MKMEVIRIDMILILHQAGLFIVIDIIGKEHILHKQVICLQHHLFLLPTVGIKIIASVRGSSSPEYSNNR